MKWKEELANAGLKKVLAWDIEAREHKPDEMSWPMYRKISGVSIAGTYDLLDPLFGWTFYSDCDEPPYDIKSLSTALMGADMTIGYNTMSYDHAVVRGLIDSHTPDKELDLYNHVIIPSIGHFPRGKGLWGIDPFCSRTINRGKTLTQGAGAPALAKEGRWGELVTYNLTDVALVAALFMWMLQNRTVVMPNGDLLEIGDALDNGIERVTGVRQESVTSGTS